MSIILQTAIRQYRQRARQLRLFDVNAWVGALSGPHIRTLEDDLALLKAMKHCGIEQAVVTHTSSVFSHLHHGHEILAGYLKRHARRFVGAFVLVPTATKEQGANAVEIIDRAVVKGFLVFRLFPASMSFSLDDWCVGDILRRLDERRLPLMLWHSETSWAQLDKICAAYPRLPVIVEGSGRKILYDNRIIYALLKRHSNLFVELHGLFNLGLIEDMARRGLAEKLIFGTAMPFFDPHVATGLLTQADINVRLAAAIGGKTLRRLLGNIA